MFIESQDLVRAIVRVRLEDKMITVKCVRCGDNGYVREDYTEHPFTQVLPVSPEVFQKHVRLSATGISIPTTQVPRFDNVGGAYFYVITPIAGRCSISRCPVDNRRFPKVLPAPIQVETASMRLLRKQMERPSEEECNAPVLSVGKISQLTGRRYGRRDNIGKPKLVMEYTHPWRKNYPDKVK